MLEYEDDLLIFDKTKDEIGEKIGGIIDDNIIKQNNIELYFSEEEIETQKALLEEICSTRRLETIRDFNKNNMLTINTRAKM